jgi:glycosyltransferase involved in cell wall biosynthesis
MRIAHVSDCYLPRLGGIERQVYGLAHRQQQLGHDVDVITSVAGRPRQDASGLLVHRPGGRPGSERIRYRAALSGVATVLDGDYDVVHAHISAFSPMAMLAAGTASRRGVPTAVTLHSLWAYATPAFRLAHRVVRWGELPVAWSAVSSVAARDLGSALPDSRRVALLPNAVDLRDWSAPRGRAFGGAGFVLTSVMRFATRKRPMALLKMLRAARERIPPGTAVEVVLAGDGPLRPRMERYLARHGMQSWVRMPGRLSPAGIRAQLHRSDTYVAPASLESFGIAALEARASGVPVIGMAGTGLAEFVQSGRDGLLVGSDAEMVDAIVRLATSPDERAGLAAYAQAHPPAFGWESVLHRCDALYRSAAALSGRELPGDLEQPLDLSLDLSLGA